MMIFFRKSGSSATIMSESKKSRALPLEYLTVSFRAFAFPIRSLLKMNVTLPSYRFDCSMKLGVASSTVTKISFSTSCASKLDSVLSNSFDSLYTGIKMLMSDSLVHPQEVEWFFQPLHLFISAY